MAKTRTRYTKDNVQLHSDSGYDPKPAVNVRVYDYKPNIFPIHMGSSYPVGHPELIEHHRTPDDFNWQWIENLGEPVISDYWQMACEDGYKQAIELASDIFGPFVQAYGAGRSGGWIEVHNLPPVEGWDAIMLGRWRRYERIVKLIAADQWRRYAELIYLNVYEGDNDASD